MQKFEKSNGGNHENFCHWQTSIIKAITLTYDPYASKKLEVKGIELTGSQRDTDRLTEEEAGPKTIRPLWLSKCENRNQNRIPVLPLGVIICDLLTLSLPQLMISRDRVMKKFQQDLCQHNYQLSYVNEVPQQSKVPRNIYMIFVAPRINTLKHTKISPR